MRKNISLNESFSDYYICNFKFNFNKPRKQVKNVIGNFTAAIMQDLREVVRPMKINEIHSVVDLFIREAIKNSYDACCDSYLNHGGDGYKADIFWRYDQRSLEVVVEDNGYGIAASNSLFKKANGNFFLGGEGQGLEMVRAYLREIKQKFGFRAKLNCQCFKPPKGGAKYSIKITFGKN